MSKRVICRECKYYVEYEVDNIMVYPMCEFWGKEQGGCHTESDASCSFGRKDERPGTRIVNCTYDEWVKLKIEVLKKRIEDDLKLVKKYKEKLK